MYAVKSQLSMYLLGECISKYPEKMYNHKSNQNNTFSMRALQKEAGEYRKHFNKRNLCDL